MFSNTIVAKTIKVPKSNDVGKKKLDSSTRSYTNAPNVDNL